MRFGRTLVFFVLALFTRNFGRSGRDDFDKVGVLNFPTRPVSSKGKPSSFLASFVHGIRAFSRTLVPRAASLLTVNNANLRPGKMTAIVILALLVGGGISQVPAALGDDSDNPLSALWDAIFDLQSRDKDLQAQIDELRAERDALLGQTESAFVSDPYAQIKVDVTDGRTLVYITAGNSGPDRAAGVKVTAFYLMPLFEINSIDGDQCEDKSRGIIECILGTLEADQESVITIDATAREFGKENTWTVDVSTTTYDPDYSNNHIEYSFETGSGERIETQVKEPEQEEIGEDETGEDSADREDLNSNSTNTGIDESQENNGNQTSTEEETSTENQTSTQTEETVDDSSSNSTSTEESKDNGGESSAEEEGSSEESTDGAANQEGQDESSNIGEEQTGSNDGQVEEQGQDEQGSSDESGADESAEESGEENSGSEESGSESSESSDSNEQEANESGESNGSGSESGDGGETSSQ